MKKRINRDTSEKDEVIPVSVGPSSKIQSVSVRSEELSENDLRKEGMDNYGNAGEDECSECNEGMDNVGNDEFYGEDECSKSNEGMDNVGNDEFHGEYECSESESEESLNKKKSESSSCSSSSKESSQ